MQEHRGVDPEALVRKWDPGSRHAVATLTDPSTPMASCTRWGMNVRVEITPPCRAGATRHIFGTVFPATRPRFIRSPAASRSASMRVFNPASASSSTPV